MKIESSADSDGIEVKFIVHDLSHEEIKLLDVVSCMFCNRHSAKSNELNRVGHATMIQPSHQFGLVDGDSYTLEGICIICIKVINNRLMEMEGASKMEPTNIVSKIVIGQIWRTSYNTWSGDADWKVHSRDEENDGWNMCKPGSDVIVGFIKDDDFNTDKVKFVE